MANNVMTSKERYKKEELINILKDILDIKKSKSSDCLNYSELEDILYYLENKDIQCFNVDNLNYIISTSKDEIDISLISDGYHTFDELYYHRMILFAVICKQNKEKAWKSKLHSDGTMFPNYFIVGIDTPDGQYSYHYHEQYWNYFNDIIEMLTAPPWDGHVSNNVNRLLKI